MRELERRVRESKRTCATYDTALKNADTDADRVYYQKCFNKSAATLKKRESSYRAYCEQIGRKTDSTRTIVGGFGRSVSSKAVHAAKNPNHNIDMQLFGKPDYTKQSVSSLGKGISSLQKQITAHNEKIGAPSLHVKNWDSFDSRRQSGLLKHWQKEINSFNKQISDMQKELEGRQK